MKRFGEKLRTLREEHSLTVRQLAGILEINSSGYITQLEKGQKTPSVPLLLKIARFFDVSTDKLLKDELEFD